MAFATAVAILAASPVPPAARGEVPGEKILALVILNSEDKGVHTLIRTADGDILMRAKDFSGIGLREMPAGARTVPATGEYLSLRSCAPEMTFEIDERAGAVRIEVAPYLFERNVIDLSARPRRAALPREEPSAFLNYSAGYGDAPEGGAASRTIHLEAGARAWGGLGLASFSYRKDGAGESFTRLSSNLTVDSVESAVRTTVGDFAANSGPLGGGGRYGGVSVSKDYSITPYVARYVGASAVGTAETPSEVDVYVNDLLVRSEFLPPGEFEFSNITAASGTGEVELVVTDAFGRQTHIREPFYRAPSLLKPGFHEFSYSLGFERKGYGEASFDYGEAAILAQHRRGVSEGLTLGGRGEASPDLVSAGPAAQFRLFRVGEVNAATALSYQFDRGDAGAAAELDYRYASSFFNTGFSLRWYSRDYEKISAAASEERLRVAGTVNLGFSFRELGSLSGSYSFEDRHSGENRRSASLFYTRSLLGKASLFVRATHTVTDRTENEVFVSLAYHLSEGWSGRASVTAGAECAEGAASIQKNAPRGRGFGLRAEVRGREGETRSLVGDASASLTYRGSHAIGNADYSRVSERDSYRLSVAGGISHVGGSVHASRPVRDGFALVRVGGLEGVTVRYGNQDVGETGSRGEVLVPDLISYHDNLISFDEKDVRVNYEVTEDSKYVTVPYRGGTLVALDVRKIQAFVGNAFFLRGGEMEPAEYAGLAVTIGEEELVAVVGRGGRFYLENIPAGAYPARLFLGERECRFEMVFPESERAMVRMGDVTCEE